MAATGPQAIEQGPRRLPAARRRTQLLDSAADLLADGHTEALTMDGIAARAGVSKALCYRYFDNADELLVAVAEREMVEVAQRVRSAMESTVTFDASVRASLAAWFDVLAERGPIILALLNTPRLAGDLGERRRQLRAVISDFYSRRAADAFGLSPRVADTATVILLAGMEGVIDCWVARGVPRRELVDTYTTICLAAFGALANEPPLIG